MNTAQERLHLIWSDKIALGLVLLTIGAGAVLWLVVLLAAGIPGANHVLASLGYTAATEGVVFLAALWAGLRALDFVFHGSTWRLFHGEPMAAPVAAPVSGNLIAN